LLTELGIKETEWVRRGARTSGARVFPSPRAEARVRGIEARRQHRPVFVDDSGRRHRVARIVGTTLGALALVYVAFVGLTFAGVAGLGRFDAAGLGSLTHPAGDHADVGSDPVEQAAPDVAGGTGLEDLVTTTDGTDQGEASSERAATPVTATTVPSATAIVPPTTTTTGVPATTTTTVHGGGPPTSDHTPNSTVPERGGPPTSLPG
jgi:hypothetical protein